MTNKARLAMAGAIAAVAAIAIAGIIMVPRLMPTQTDETDFVAVEDEEHGDEGVRPVIVGEDATTEVDVTSSDMEPEPAGDMRGASVLSGEVGYDDIPEPSQIVGDYAADDIKDAIVSYLQSAYPSEVVASLQLMGNGVSPSQEAQEDSSYMCYLVTTAKGRDIGLFTQCSDSAAPRVTEASYLIVSPTLLYDVANKEYIPMEASGEEPDPHADTVPAGEGSYPDPYAMPEPGSYKDRMRRLPIPAEAGSGEQPS